MDDLLRAGIAAAKSGRRERARDLLTRAVEQNESSAPAWLWLSSVVDAWQDREVCLENVLALEPDNAAALRGLEWVREQKELASPPAASESPVVARSHTPVSLAAAILRREPDTVPEEPPGAAQLESIAAALRQEVERGRLPPLPEQPSPPPIRDELGDEYLCPYCAAPTAPKDRKCPVCGGDLWVKIRPQKRSKPLWLAMGLQLSGLSTSVAAFALLFIYVAVQVGVDDPFDLFLAYLGTPAGIPPDVLDAALELLPRSSFFLSALPPLLTLTMLVGLYARWKPIYYLYWLGAVAALVVSLVEMFLWPGPGLIAGGVGVLFALLMFSLVFRLEDDFKVERKRLLLRLDRGLGNLADFLLQGDLYARQKMWALAAIHLRRAVGYAPAQLEPRVSLALAYAHLKRYDLSARELEEADRISPGNPRVAELVSLVDDLRSEADSARSPQVAGL